MTTDETQRPPDPDEPTLATGDDGGVNESPPSVDAEEGGLLHLPVERLLEGSRALPDGEILGSTPEGRPIVGYAFGAGDIGISLIGGCHADEPVGPDMLRRLVGWLAAQPASAPVLSRIRWRIVPHVNPDGEGLNQPWAEETVAVNDHLGVKDRGYDLPTYLRHVQRALPGQDLEWGFPAEAEDLDEIFATGVDEEGPLAPENLAVARFLADGAPYRLHISFHSMAFAIGPWFLLDPAWVERTEALRQALVRRTDEMGLPLHDIDRQGEKGFHRIAEGFSTTPNSRAMAAHFISQGDAETAALFRPSSMEYVRALGGDPLTLVSEMPLFLIPPPPNPEEDGEDSEATPMMAPEDDDTPPPPTGGTRGRQAFFAWARRFHDDPEGLRRQTHSHGWRALAIKDQMRLQLDLLNEGLRAIETSELP